MLIREVVELSGLQQAQIARDADLSYYAIRAWLKGERTPEPESLAKLIAGLRSRAHQIEELADKLERDAGEG